MFGIRWFPWRTLVSRLATSRGFIDPMAVLARLGRFAQPSEVSEPIELLRAGLIFHARGLINTRAIQHNLDWVWPFWIHRQFDPHDPAFLPRAFSITHVNLTHRSWTAVGQPDLDQYPIVDPRGMVTPLYDGWSLDAWILPEDEGDRQRERALIPSRAPQATQRLLLDENLRIETIIERGKLRLKSEVDVAWEQERPVCRVRFEAAASERARLVVALRPVNPEGVAEVALIDVDATGKHWGLEGGESFALSEAPQAVALSKYKQGDVFGWLDDEAARARRRVKCDVGMASGAAIYPLGGHQPRQITARIPLPTWHKSTTFTSIPPATPPGEASAWRKAIDGAAQLQVPDRDFQFLYNAALRTLVLHAPHEVYPGPYTYRRFWYRDAVFMVHALLVVNLPDRAERAIKRFPQRQDASGYFHSQEGEWDSNGQVLWLLQRFRELTGRELPRTLLSAARSGAGWIQRKRTSEADDLPHAGLLPAGFSAEHLGTNDYYYWDDFFAVAGLRAASTICAESGYPAEAERYTHVAERMSACIERSLEQSPVEAVRRGRALPASPYRRMDAGAVGSLAVGYPLQLWAPDDPRLLGTVDYLLEDCMVRGGFFQQMIHSGINAYLTLHMAQVLLRAGDERAIDLVRAVAGLASPTGQWPEAIHPGTLGGCMGDGQHAWAAAEWLVMVRQMFVIEEPGELVLGAGVLPEWLREGERVSFGPSPTRFGAVSVTVEPGAGDTMVRWDATWRSAPGRVTVRLPGHEPVAADPHAGQARAARRPSAS